MSCAVIFISYIIQIALGKGEIWTKLMNSRIFLPPCCVIPLFLLVLGSLHRHAPTCYCLVISHIFELFCKMLLQHLIHRKALCSDYFRVKPLNCILTEQSYYLVSSEYHLCLKITGTQFLHSSVSRGWLVKPSSSAQFMLRYALAFQAFLYRGTSTLWLCHLSNMILCATPSSDNMIWLALIAFIFMQNSL